MRLENGKFIEEGSTWSQPMGMGYFDIIAIDEDKKQIAVKMHEGGFSIIHRHCFSKFGDDGGYIFVSNAECDSYKSFKINWDTPDGIFQIKESRIPWVGATVDGYLIFAYGDERVVREAIAYNSCQSVPCDELNRYEYAYGRKIIK